jgi:hypothetical protein
MDKWGSEWAVSHVPLRTLFSPASHRLHIVVEREKCSGHERIMCGPGIAVNGLKEDGAELVKEDPEE